jgi:hypothetical protein
MSWKRISSVACWKQLPPKFLQVGSRSYQSLTLSPQQPNSIPTKLLGFLKVAPAVPEDVLSHYAHQMGIFLDVLTPEQQQVLWTQSQRKLRRIPFQQQHFDQVIHGYRELSVSHWKLGWDPVQAQRTEAQVTGILDRCFDLLNTQVITSLDLFHGWLPVHLLELNEAGIIRPHVDHLTVRSCTSMLHLELKWQVLGSYLNYLTFYAGFRSHCGSFKLRSVYPSRF